MAEQDNQDKEGALVIGPRVIRRVVNEGLEIIAAKYLDTVQVSRKKQETKPIYRTEMDSESVFLVYHGDPYSWVKGPTQDTRITRPELINYPIQVQVGARVTDSSKPINIFIRNEYWRKEAEFLAGFMKKVLPEYFNQANIRIVNDFLTPETKGRLEAIVKEYKKPEQDSW